MLLSETPEKKKEKLNKMKTLISSFLSCLWETLCCAYLLSPFSDQGVVLSLCDWETSHYVTFSFLGLTCNPFLFCRHMGSLKSMRHGSLLKAWPFTSSPWCARTLVSALFVLFCNCYFFLITWMRTNDRTKFLKKVVR